jgi:hypothetical protein
MVKTKWSPTWVLSLLAGTGALVATAGNAAEPPATTNSSKPATDAGAVLNQVSSYSADNTEDNVLVGQVTSVSQLTRYDNESFVGCDKPCRFLRTWKITSVPFGISSITTMNRYG